MTKEEMTKVLSFLKKAYPFFYKDITPKEGEEIADLWYEMFKEDDVVLVIKAVKLFIKSDRKGFPPVIGVIKAKMEEIVEASNSQQISEFEAWQMVKCAVKNSLYNSKEEFDKLYVYETVPTCSLKYILTIDKIVEYPTTHAVPVEVRQDHERRSSSFPCSHLCVLALWESPNHSVQRQFPLYFLPQMQDAASRTLRDQSHALADFEHRKSPIQRCQAANPISYPVYLYDSFP